MRMQEGRMEYWVNSGVIRQLQAIGNLANTLENFKWAKEALGKLVMCNSSDRNLSIGAEFNIYPLSNLVVWHPRRTSCVLAP